MKKIKTEHFLLFRIFKESLFIFTALLFLNNTTASNLRVENIMSKKVTLSLRNVSLEEALHELEVQGELKFSYNSRILKMKDKISIEVYKETILNTLIKLLKPHNITFLVISNHIILRKKNTL